MGLDRVQRVERSRRLAGIDVDECDLVVWVRLVMSPQRTQQRQRLDVVQERLARQEQRTRVTRARG